MLRPGETREQMESDGAIAELLKPWVDPRAVHIERRAVYRFHARCCERFSVGRVFLAGDAAHVTPPFVGQGLVAGLRDAVNLSWKLAWVLQKRARPAILDSYDIERRPHAKKMIDLARLMGQAVMPQSKPRAIAVHGAMALARRLPFVRPYLDELGIKPANTFATGLFAHGRGKVRRGSWWPQVRLRAPSGATERSDDVLGTSLALMFSGVARDAMLSVEARRRWTAAGGALVALRGAGSAGTHGEGHEDVDGVIVPKRLAPDWCVVVRPDRTVLHDGPVADAERIVRESLEVLGSPA
jgi:3-(3-hydroxy-phenyl)propionate hydroxylase